MDVYHASSQVVKHPDVKHSRSNLDFGIGFYVTTLKSQALDYGKRFIRRSQKAFLNTYTFDLKKLQEFNVMKFDSYNEEWLKFVLDCRNGKDFHDWDVVIGGIADDRVFATMELFFAGVINMDEALGRLTYIKPNNQICLCSQEAIDELLRFKGAVEIHE